ncbi:MAG: hypothetical protein ACWA5W_03235, partial [Phycisphaerales bacterium]
LEVYFANMEIDGVEPVDPGSQEQILLPTDPQPTDPNQPTNQSTSQSLNQGGGQPDGPSGHAATMSTPMGDDVGVRVSLLGGGSTTDQSGQPNQPDKANQPPAGASNGADTSSPQLDSSATPEERKLVLARELAGILRSLASSSDDPGASALALAGLELLLPEDTGELVDEGVLSDAERLSLDAARAFLRSLSADGSIASPDQIAKELKDIQIQLGTWTGMEITKSALCTSVQGFGRYETFPSYRFIAGKAQPAIVYVELERFGQRAFVGPDGQPRYEIKLSQRLELYHVADDLNTWNRAAETVTDVSRNTLRDYYLINKITLPANLGVGRYHLKVVMRDLIDDTVAETIIPIEIVLR